MKISHRLYKILIFLGGITTLSWLLLLPTDPKNIWLLGYSKSRAIMMLLVILYNLPIASFLILSFKDKKKYQKIIDFVKKLLLNKVLGKMIIRISFLAITVSSFFLFIAFGATNDHLHKIFSRLAPLMFLIVSNGIATLLFLYFNNLISEKKLRPIRAQISELTLLSSFLLLFLVISAGSIQNKSHTADEFKHFRYGKNMLKCKIRSMSSTDSGACRPLIPEHAVH